MTDRRCTGLPVAPRLGTRTLDCQHCPQYKLPTRERRSAPPEGARVVSGRVECPERQKA